jgi:hypothetical protein
VVGDGGATVTEVDDDEDGEVTVTEVADDDEVDDTEVVDDTKTTTTTPITTTPVTTTVTVPVTTTPVTTTVPPKKTTTVPTPASNSGLNSAMLLALLAGQQPRAPTAEENTMDTMATITPYDWSSIFANKEQEARYISPYTVNAAAGGAVDDMVDVNNELLRFLRG